MKEIVLQRIKSIMAAKSKSETEFAKLSGVSQATLNNYTRLNRMPSLEVIIKILAAFPDISAEWLLRGTGTMYHQPTADVTINGPQSIKGNNNITNSRHIQVPSSQNDDIIQLLRQQVEQQIKSLNDLVHTLANK